MTGVVPNDNLTPIPKFWTLQVSCHLRSLALYLTSRGSRLMILLRHLIRKLEHLTQDRVLRVAGLGSPSSQMPSRHPRHQASEDHLDLTGEQGRLFGAR